MSFNLSLIEDNIFFLSSKDAKPALFFLLLVPLYAEPNGKNGLAHISEHIILSLIEKELSFNSKNAFAFYAHTSFSAIQFNFPKLQDEEQIIQVYKSIFNALQVNNIDKKIIKDCKNHVIQECKGLKEKYASVKKECKFLTGYKNINLPVGKVKDIQNITEKDILQFIHTYNSKCFFIIVNNKKIKLPKLLLNSKIKQSFLSKNILMQGNIKKIVNKQNTKNFLHIKLKKYSFQKISFSIKLENETLKNKNFILVILKMFIIECMNLFFKNKKINENNFTNAYTNLKKIDKNNIFSFIDFNIFNFNFALYANNLQKFIIDQNPSQKELADIKKELLNSFSFEQNTKVLVNNIILHIEYSTPLLITNIHIENAKKEIQKISIKSFCEFKNKYITKENFKIIIKDVFINES